MSAISTGGFLSKMGNREATEWKARVKAGLFFQSVPARRKGQALKSKKMISRPGFTFIEVLMAVSILAILLVGAFPGYVWSLRMETTDADILKKLAYPMQQIEVTISFNKGERTYRLRTYRWVPDDAAGKQNKRSGLS